MDGSHLCCIPLRTKPQLGRCWSVGHGIVLGLTNTAMSHVMVATIWHPSRAYLATGRGPPYAERTTTRRQMQ